MSGAILSIRPNSTAHSPFALKLRDDTIKSLLERSAKKLNLPQTEEIRLKYAWQDIYWALDDGEDWDIFLDRVQSLPPGSREVDMILECPFLPKDQPRSSSTGPVDSASLYSQPPRKKTRDVSLHVISSTIYGSETGGSGREGSIRSGHTAGTKATKASRKSRRAESTASTATEVPAHKIAFENFVNQQGTRTVVGSIGPVENVRMMMKPGHRYVYMSRSFALTHGFIPKDAAPGFYGFSGITSLGSWPIKVGEKTVQQQVQLVESSYFPVILGRSFMERRGVKTSPLDPTNIIFLDTGETIDCDLVVVKDSLGQVIPVS